MPAALASGDRRAAEDLVEATYRKVFASLVRLTGGDGDLAADLTQETYRKAWQSLPRFERRSQVATWLYRIAMNVTRSFILKRTRNRVDLREHCPEEPDPAPAPAERVIETREIVRKEYPSASESTGDPNAGRFLRMQALLGS